MCFTAHPQADVWEKVAPESESPAISFLKSIEDVPTSEACILEWLLNRRNSGSGSHGISSFVYTFRH